MKKKLISVTWEDINKGDHQADRCPIARAVQRAFKKGKDFCSVSSNGNIYWGEKVFRNEQIKAFVNNFDSEFPVVPFEFELEC